MLQNNLKLLYASIVHAIEISTWCGFLVFYLLGLHYGTKCDISMFLGSSFFTYFSLHRLWGDAFDQLKFLEHN